MRTDANTAESGNGEGEEGGETIGAWDRRDERGKADDRYGRGEVREGGAREDSAISGRPLASLVALRHDGGGGRDDAWAATRRHSGGREGMRTTVERTVR